MAHNFYYIVNFKKENKDYFYYYFQKFVLMPIYYTFSRFKLRTSGVKMEINNYKLEIITFNFGRVGLLRW